ncbi:MAG: hypothetical protein HYX53_08475 [Chloroflexi bacterium]|nr:hypothetical protein [Chloroflexota bacterium]
MDLVIRNRQGSREQPTAAAGGRTAWLKPLAWGLVAASLLVGFYLAIITVAQDWTHAREQLQTDRWFVAAISIGFGVQVGLFVHLRALHARSNAGTMAASTGTSTVAMLACCAHHLADALPLIGLSGAAVFLNDFKGPILWTGIVMNGLGIAYLVRKIWQQRAHVLRFEAALELAPPHCEPLERG